MNKILNKWICAYDNAKRMQKNGWSENDVLAKAHELYSSGKSGHFILISEWLALRDQPRYGSQEKELERLDKIAMRQEEANQLLKENIEAKRMKMFMKLSSKEHLDDRSKELLKKLGRDLFGN
ncbi:unnamed protein product [Vicia faba]|uniref:Uncharacterized protein n=1 Tax=Vicia faba TaxID=3906 RepID=A0AAV0YKK9_VICFA|nr:unnamed protein product [Vicia faba]